MATFAMRSRLSALVLTAVLALGSNVTPALAAACSASSMSTSGNTTTLTFTTVGSCVVTLPTRVTSISYDVVGGGGGGGTAAGAAAGGAGGQLVEVTNVAVVPGSTLSLVVGAGGAYGNVTNTQYAADGSAGGSSSVTVGSSTTTAIGGAGGNGTDNKTSIPLNYLGANGTGGAAGRATFATGSSAGNSATYAGGAPGNAAAVGGVTPLGYNCPNLRIGGGGAGTGQAGHSATELASVAGWGGNGAASTLTGLTYGGGGGGHIEMGKFDYLTSASKAQGGTGGGGAGAWTTTPASANVVAASGTNGLGGGGGASGGLCGLYYPALASHGGLGGSGTVVIQYTTNTINNLAFTSTPTTAVANATYTPTVSSTSGQTVSIGSATPSVCSVPTGAMTPSAVVTFISGGTCTLTADQAATSSYPAATQVQQSFTVTQASQSVSFITSAPASAQVGDTYTPSASATSGLPVAYSIATASSSVCSMDAVTHLVTFAHTGVCTINADQAGNIGSAAAATASQSSTVTALQIIFNANQGSGTMAAQSVVSVSPVALTANSFTRVGYSFGGWNTAANGSGTAYSDGQSVQFVAADVTLYAIWTLNTYTVTYGYNGATGSASTTSATFTTGGTAIVLPTPTRTGYTFAGWYSDSGFTSLIGLGGSNYSPNGTSLSFTAYAKWTANTSTITYDSNGATSGAASRSSDSYVTGAAGITLPTVGTLARPGFNFLGWSLSAGGSALTGSSATAFTTTSSVTLYAVWQAKTIQVTYLKGAASASTVASFPADTSAVFGSPFTLATGVTSRVDIGGNSYDFLGWSDGTSTYAAGQTYVLPSVDVTLTAQWARVFEVRYTLNGGTHAGSETDLDAECTHPGNLCLDQQVITLNATPTRAGYNFSGWIDQQGASSTASALKTITATSYLFYAQWSPIDYTVTYDSAGGSTAPTHPVVHIGDQVIVAANPSRVGYTFNGWRSGSVNYGAGATYTVGAANITFTAQWTANTYVVGFNWNGASGSSSANASYTSGSTGLTLPVVTDQRLDGYTFNGWALPGGSSLVTSPFIPTADVVLVAQWGAGNYDVTVYGNGANFNNGVAQVQSHLYTVANGTTLVLPAITRTNFHFMGWFTAASGGSQITLTSGAFQPLSSSPVYAQWVQDSLYNVGSKTLILSLLTVSGQTQQSTGTHTASGNSVTVTVLDGALPAGTEVKVFAVTDDTNASALITPIQPEIQVLTNIVVSWLAPDGTVPTTAAGKPISVQINNSSIKVGASLAIIVNGLAQIVGTAAVDGTITATITDDPGLVVIATRATPPTAPLATASDRAAYISWTAPGSNGGSAITQYRVTSSGGQTCLTTGALSCIVTGLTNGTSYTFTIQALNGVGTSLPSTASSAVVPIGSQTLMFISSAPSAVVGGTYTPSVRSTSDLAVTLRVDPLTSTVCSVSGSTVTMLTEGECVVIASQSGNPAYLPASDVYQSFNVVAAPIPNPTPDGPVLPWAVPVVVAEANNGIAVAVTGATTTKVDAKLSKFNTDFQASIGSQNLKVAMQGGAPVTGFISKTRLVLQTSATLVITGSGYNPYSLVRIWLFPEAKMVSNFTTDAKGGFAASLPLGTKMVLGNHVLVVQALNSKSAVAETEVPFTLVQWVKYNTNVDFPVKLGATNATQEKALSGVVMSISKMALQRVTAITFYHFRAQKSDAVVAAKADMKVLQTRLTECGATATLRSQAKQIKLHQKIKPNFYINLSGFKTS